MSNTARTMREIRKRGGVCAVAEKWNPHVGPHGIRQDLFGFVDVLVIEPDHFLAVQCCARSGHASHRRKILDNEFAPMWLEAGGRIELWSWAKQKVKRGGKAERWTPKVEEITAESFDDSP